MDAPYIKLLFLIIPAIITALAIVLSPIIEEKKYKNNLIGKTITISINICDEKRNEIEIYRTHGVIEKITEDILEVKRKTHPKFRVPFIPQNLIHFPKSSFESEYFSTFTINSEKDLDKNRGILSSLLNFTK